jgi:hypothetical protein
MIARSDHAAHLIRLRRRCDCEPPAREGAPDDRLHDPIQNRKLDLFCRFQRRQYDSEANMTAYLISLALAGLIAVALWEGFA